MFYICSTITNMKKRKTKTVVGGYRTTPKVKEKAEERALREQTTLSRKIDFWLQNYSGLIVEQEREPGYPHK